MAKKGSFSKVYDKNGDYADVEAVRFDGTRTFQMQGDVTASQTWNGDPASPLTLNTSIGAKKVTQYNIADKAVGTGQMADGSVGLTQMAASAMTDTVSANNSKLVTSQGVNAAIAAATLNRGKDYGPMSVDEINAISETIPTGSTVYVEHLGAGDAKVINDGYSDGTMASFSVEVGEDLKYYRAPDNSLHGWYSTEANVKIKQPANYAGGIAVDSAQDASSGSAGIEFIQSFKQDTNGNIRDIVKAQVDIVDSTSSARTNAAATPNSVKSAYDLANGKYSKPSGGIPKSDLASGVQASLDKADSALQSSDVAHTYTYNSEAPISGRGVTEKYLLKASTLTSSDDIDNLNGKMPVTVRGTKYLFQGPRTVGGTFPGIKKAFQLSVLIQHELFQYMTQELWYTDDYDEYHWVRKCVNGKWQAWKMHWDEPTSTYSSRGSQPVNGQAVASAISGKEDNSNKVTSFRTTPDNTHYPSEKLVKDGLDTKADANKVVAIADAQIVRSTATSDNWLKAISHTHTTSNTNLVGVWKISFVEEAASHIAYEATLIVNIRCNGSGQQPTIYNAFLKTESSYSLYSVCVEAIGVAGNVVANVYFNVPSYGAITIKCLSNGARDLSLDKNFWKYTSYGASATGVAKPVADESTNTKVQDVLVSKVQYNIASPTNNNLVAMDANGNLTDSGKKASDFELVANKVTSWQTTPDNTHYPSEKLVKDGLDAKTDLVKSVAIFDGYVSRLNESPGWRRLAYKQFNGTNTNINALFRLYLIGSNNYHIGLGDLFVNIRFNSSGSAPEFPACYLMSHKPLNTSIKLKVVGVAGNAVVEVWFKPPTFSCLMLSCLGNGFDVIAKTKDWTFKQYLDATDSEPVEDTANHIYVFSGTVRSVQYDIASPTNNNLVAMDANGLVKDSGVAVLPSTSTWDGTSDAKVPTAKAVQAKLDAISTAAGAEAEVTAAALDDLDARMQSVEDAVNSDNIGDKIADSLDAQVLKVGGQDVVANIEYVAAQSGGGGDLMKTVAGTQTSVLRFMNDSEAVSIWNDAKQAAANAS